MKIHVFYKIEQNPGLRNTVEAPLSVRAELEKLRNELSLAKNEGEKKITLRKIARLERFEKVSEQSGENTEAIGKVLKGKTSETYLGSDLLSLKKRGVDIASLVLVSEEKVEGDVIGAKMDAGNKFIVNFGVNKGLNANIGAGDILSADITTIRVNGVEGVRRNTPRPGYYAGNKYLPIFDGDSLEIVKKSQLNEEELKVAQSAGEQRWKHQRVSDMIDHNGKNPLTDLPEDTALFSEVTTEIKRRDHLKNIASLGIEGIGEFKNDAIAAAKKVEELFGIPWQVAYGQAALESGHGKHAPNNNYFGIKGSGSSLSTKEFLDGNWVTVNDSFRGYSSLQDSFLGYGKFITENSRYRNAFLYKENPTEFLREIKRAGYATDPDYVSKIEAIWRQSNISLS